MKRRYKQYSKWNGSRGWKILKKIETDCNCGFLKTCLPDSFTKFIFVTVK